MDFKSLAKLELYLKKIQFSKILIHLKPNFNVKLQ